MKITLSIMKAEIGSIAGHNGPSQSLLEIVRDNVGSKAIDIRRQGFFGAAMLPMSELESTGIMSKLKALDERFRLRN